MPLITLLNGDCTESAHHPSECRLHSVIDAFCNLPMSGRRHAHATCLWWLQVIGVMDAMPNSNLKPEGEDAVLESDRMYRTTYMFRCCADAASCFHCCCCCCCCCCVHVRYCKPSIVHIMAPSFSFDQLHIVGECTHLCTSNASHTAHS